MVLFGYLLILFAYKIGVAVSINTRPLVTQVVTPSIQLLHPSSPLHSTVLLSYLTTSQSHGTVRHGVVSQLQSKTRSAFQNTHSDLVTSSYLTAISFGGTDFYLSSNIQAISPGQTLTGSIVNRTAINSYGHVSVKYPPHSQQANIQPTGISTPALSSSSYGVAQTPSIKQMSGPTPPSITQTPSPPKTASTRSSGLKTSNSTQPLGPLPPMAVGPICAHAGGCCIKALKQFRDHVEFEENQPLGTVLVPIFGVNKVSINFRVVDPPELHGYLEEYFNISRSGASSYMFQIVKHIDIEDLYLKANKNVRVTNFQVEIECVDDIPGNTTAPPQTMNITILDVDDTIPVFQDISGHEHCVVPVYTVNTSDTYLGKLEVSPTQISAVDGDLIQRNNISYRVMHAEPYDYNVYFELNATDGTVSKTKTMNSTNPIKYVIFVEALEDSPDQQNRVAILSIKVVPIVVITEKKHTVNATLKLTLEIASVVVIAGFISGFTILVWYRKRVKERRVDVEDEFGDYELPTLAVYESSCSSLSSAQSEIPPIASPSTIIVTPARPGPCRSPYAATRNNRFIQREKSPIDTALRPAWNARKPTTMIIKCNTTVKNTK